MSDLLTQRPVPDALAETAAETETLLQALLPAADGAERRVIEAMRYSTLGAGKRLRPHLVVASTKVCGGPHAAALRAGAAVEMIHTYSLIHDDLPAMDDDDLRRGRPSCHVAYDEATAILAGDALLTLAFEVLADPATHDDAAVRCAVTAALAQAAGARGMVGGQMIDLEAERRPADQALIVDLQRKKTGALIAFCCEAGALLSGASAEQRNALRDYGYALGLTFQITDDLLDVEGDEANLGKTVGKDADAGKATFVSILGLEEARAEAARQAANANACLDAFGQAADELRAIAAFVLARKA